MKRDRRNVLDLLAEQDEALTFTMFQTPNDLIRKRIPAEMTIKCTPPQGSVLLKVLNKAAVMDSTTYLGLYQKTQTTVLSGSAMLNTDINIDLCLTRDEVITLLDVIKLTDANIINPRLGVRDAMWALRQDILKQIGIREVS